MQQKQPVAANTSFKTIDSTKSNAFIEQLTEGLGLFTSKKLDIFLTFQQLNKNVLYNRKTSELIKRKVLNLRRFNREEFFSDAIAILIICVTQHCS